MQANNSSIQNKAARSSSCVNPQTDNLTASQVKRSLSKRPHQNPTIIQTAPPKEPPVQDNNTIKGMMSKSFKQTCKSKQSAYDTQKSDFGRQIMLDEYFQKVGHSGFARTTCGGFYKRW